MIELKGKPVADDIKEKAIKRVEELRSQGSYKDRDHTGRR